MAEDCPLITMKFPITPQTCRLVTSHESCTRRFTREVQVPGPGGRGASQEGGGTGPAAPTLAKTTLRLRHVLPPLPLTSRTTSSLSTQFCQPPSHRRPATSTGSHPTNPPPSPPSIYTSPYTSHGELQHTDHYLLIQESHFSYSWHGLWWLMVTALARYLTGPRPTGPTLPRPAHSPSSRYPQVLTTLTAAPLSEQSLDHTVRDNCDQSDDSCTLTIHMTKLPGPAAVQHLF